MRIEGFNLDRTGIFRRYRELGVEEDVVIRSTGAFGARVRVVY